jgi:hypothetical protein
LVRAIEGTPKLASARSEKDRQEAAMAARTATQRIGRQVLGKALLTLGGIFLVAQVALLSWHLKQYWNQSGAEAMGAVSAMGTAAVHLVNTVAWNPSAVLASATAVLVSCWPLLLVVAGMFLLGRRSGNR